MPDVVDLSALKKQHPSATETSSTTKKQVKSALLLIEAEDGTWQATPDLTVVDQIVTQGTPDGNALIAGLHVMISDIQAEKTANMVTVMMQQIAMQQMQAMQNQQMVKGLGL